MEFCGPTVMSLIEGSDGLSETTGPDLPRFTCTSGPVEVRKQTIRKDKTGGTGSFELNLPGEGQETVWFSQSSRSTERWTASAG